jgi:hypothetical protein
MELKVWYLVVTPYQNVERVVSLVLFLPRSRQLLGVDMAGEGTKFLDEVLGTFDAREVTSCRHEPVPDNVVRAFDELSRR